MGATWFPLFTGPDDPKILRIAFLTAEQKEIVFACCVRWFMHVDFHLKTARSGLDAASIHHICRWRDGVGSLVEAMQDKDIGWLKRCRDNTFEVAEFERWFSKGAKRRQVEALKKRRQRGGTPSGQRGRSDRDTVSRLDDERAGPTTEPNRTDPSPAQEDNTGPVPVDAPAEKSAPHRGGDGRWVADAPSWISRRQFAIANALQVSASRYGGQDKPIAAVLGHVVNRTADGPLNRDTLADRFTAIAAEVAWDPTTKRPCALWQFRVDKLLADLGIPRPKRTVPRDD